MLFHREALRREANARADRILDTSAGFTGGEEASSAVRQLRQ